MAESKFIKCIHKFEDGSVCGKEFEFTVKDQEFYAIQRDPVTGQSWKEPRRCFEHRKMQRARFGDTRAPAPAPVRTKTVDEYLDEGEEGGAY